MAIQTQQSFSGFVASDPQLTRTENGDARLYMKVGKEHYRQEQDGSFTQLETTFHHLVMFGRSANHAHDRFRKGDNFIAEGRSNTHEYQGEQREQFIASRIGHDNNRTTYTVDRSRQERTGADREAPERTAGERDPAAVALAQREQALQPEAAAGNGGATPVDRAAVAR